MLVLGIGTRLVARAALAATRIFYTVSRQGPPLPPGPVLVVANHPNSVLDALVIFIVAGRTVHPLARAPLFERPVIGDVLRHLGGLPVYRAQDSPNQMGQNEATFDAAVAALRAGEAVLVFPEGTSHSEPEIAPLRTGAARIALRTEDAADWQLGLAIVPVGLTYRRKPFFRGEVAAFVGDALAVAPWREAAGRDPHAAVRDLTAAIAAALEDVTLQLHRPEDEVLLDAAESLYAAERTLHPAGDPELLAARLPRLQLFAAGMRWLRVYEPERFDRLASAVRRHAARLARLGLSDVDLENAGLRLSALRALGRDSLLAIGTLPLAALGCIAWSIPYALPRVVLLFYTPAYEAQATVKLVTALIVFPLSYAAWIVLAAASLGVVGALLAAIVLPVAGFAALQAKVHWNELVADARFLLLSLRKRGLAAQLRARRAEIAADIDRVALDWEAETRRRGDATATFASG